MQTEWKERFCVDCGEVMVPRRNKETGERFYGCSAYPECKYTEEDEEYEDNPDWHCNQ